MSLSQHAEALAPRQEDWGPRRRAPALAPGRALPTREMLI